MLNRGSLQEVYVEDVGMFKVVPIVGYPIQEWEPAICPLCRDFRSMAIKPKESETSWLDITTSQLSVKQKYDIKKVESFLTGMLL
jgi:hypothetical protein